MSNSHNPEAIGPMWDRRYREHGWSPVPDENLVELVSPLRAGRALDLGCGTGRNALWLARTGWSVTGVDASSVGLEMAAEQATREGVQLHTVQADLVDYVPEPASFDLVVVANIHLVPEQRDAFFDRAAAAVAPGGHLFIVGHHVQALGKSGPPVVERLFVESLFEDRFDSLTTKVLERRDTRSDAGDTEDVSVLFWAERRDVEVAR
ncbi:MAG: methyltransferase domain-containing protein [Actinomycetota bacterium]|nr:methyltransferase domain-containing protein [Actinomycetota bacterium]